MHTATSPPPLAGIGTPADRQGHQDAYSSNTACVGIPPYFAGHPTAQIPTRRFSTVPCGGFSSTVSRLHTFCWSESSFHKILCGLYGGRVLAPLSRLLQMKSRCDTLLQQSTVVPGDLALVYAVCMHADSSLVYGLRYYCCTSNVFKSQERVQYVVSIVYTYINIVYTSVGPGQSQKIKVVAWVCITQPPRLSV